MNPSRAIKISRYLSKHLRHQPERIGLQLQPGGWVSVEELLNACRLNRFYINRAELEEVVATNDKQRFSFNHNKTLIRANQGHSVEIDLQLEPKIPPDVLYHGSAKQFVDSILKSGLKKMSRHHVHLSSDVTTAKRVGSRRGFPVVFTVDAKAMCEAGFSFYCSDNGVWLVDFVPPNYLHKISNVGT